MAREILLTPQVHPTTKQVAKARVVVCRDANPGLLAELSLWLPYNAKTPNETLVGQHWNKKHKLTKAWERAIEIAIGEHIGATTLSGFESAAAALGLSPIRSRMRVSITRLVPHRKHFVKDDDNLDFIRKPILDALKRSGLIKDDKREYLDAPRPGQALSGDGLHWTVIRIEPSAATYEEAGGFDAAAEKLLARAGVLR